MKLNRFSTFALLSLCMMTLPMVALAYSTVAVSEEDPPAACDVGDAIYAAMCHGGFCDNTSLYCDDTNYPVYRRYWTSNFSEESPNNYRYCGYNEIMTGLSCSGAYCDNVAIECSQIPRARYNCQWVGPFSEEQGFAYFGGKYANGMWCTGSYCDNHYFYVCNF